MITTHHQWRENPQVGQFAGCCRADSQVDEDWNQLNNLKIAKLEDFVSHWSPLWCGWIKSCSSKLTQQVDVLLPRRPSSSPSVKTASSAFAATSTYGGWTCQCPGWYGTMRTQHVVMPNYNYLSNITAETKFWSNSSIETVCGSLIQGVQGFQKCKW